MFLIAESTAKKVDEESKIKRKLLQKSGFIKIFVLSGGKRQKKSLSLTPSEEIDALLFLKLSKKRQFDKIWIV